MKTKVILISLAMMAFVGTAIAQTSGNKAVAKADNKVENVAAETPNRGPNFVDANNDGVCDKLETNTKKCCKGQGLRDGSGRKNGMGQGLRQGKRDGSGPAAGKGPNFVDANNNGVCDNKE